MKSLTKMQITPQAATFDLCRLSKSKERADVCPNTVRAYAAQGLPIYRQGKTVWFSLGELEAFIKNQGRINMGAN